MHLPFTNGEKHNDQPGNAIFYHFVTLNSHPIIASVNGVSAL